jgi:hypothetical protein
MDNMSSTIFLIGLDNALTELRQTPYESEDILQQLLGDHPSVLGSTSGADDRLLLIARELSVPDELSGNARWALDHLFVDQSGVPVLVEVKRASDTRSRREVVAQMLDYAANGSAYWPIEHLVGAFTKTATEREVDPEGELREFLQGGEPEAFWRQIEANLRAGRVRLVFVADRIPKELRRIVEFLNEQMRPAEVLALELEQFATPGGVRTLIPRLIGNTVQAQATKTVRATASPISNEHWLADLDTRCGQVAGRAARIAATWLHEIGLKVGVTESHDAMLAAVSLKNGKSGPLFYVRRSTGKLETSLPYLQTCPAFGDDASRKGILDRLRSLPGVQITTTKLTGFPAIPLTDLDRPEVWTGFQLIASDILERLRQ